MMTDKSKDRDGGRRKKTVKVDEDGEDKAGFRPGIYRKTR